MNIDTIVTGLFGGTMSRVFSVCLSIWVAYEIAIPAMKPLAQVSLALS